MIQYQLENDLSPKEFRDLLVRSTLGERRPVNDLKRIEAMVKNANLIFTARDNEQLIGVARSLTDFVYCTYLSDLAVDVKHQNQGIGKQLINLTKQKTPQATLILLAAPKAIAYYPKVGMNKHDACFYLNDKKNSKK